MTGSIVSLSEARERRNRSRERAKYEAKRDEAQRIASERLHRLLGDIPQPPGAA